MADETLHFTADEILTELRRRQRATAGAPRGVAPMAPRARRAAAIGAVATGTLVRELRRAQRAIYGVDDRKDAFEMPRDVRALASASVALVQAEDLVRHGRGWRLRTTSYREDYNLCSEEPFVKQPLGCFCSGVLVRPDVIATAGHCVEKQSELAGMRFVFGFRMLTRNKAQTTFDDDDVYQGKALIGQQLTADGTDWALVQLDRRVKGRTPVKFRTAGKVAENDKLFVIGHPCGLPQKFADGARVQQNSRRDFFTATLDTYGGNSGSPVFSEKTKRLEGLLVRGQTDFVSVGDCQVSQVFPSTGAGGEDVTRATVWSGRVPKAANGGRGRRR